MVENNYSVHFTKVAMKGLDDVYGYISVELFVESAATDLLDRIESNILNLAIFPYSGSLLHDGYLRTEGYRRLICDSYL